MSSADRRLFYLLLVATAILNLIDMAITLHGNAWFGTAGEANPLMAYLLLCPVLFVAYKLIAPVIYIAIALIVARKYFKMAFWATAAIVAVYFLIVAWNVVDWIRAEMILRGIG